MPLNDHNAYNMEDMCCCGNTYGKHHGLECDNPPTKRKFKLASSVQPMGVMPGFRQGGSFAVPPTTSKLEAACKHSTEAFVAAVGEAVAVKFLAKILAKTFGTTVKDMQSLLWSAEVTRRLAEREAEPREGRGPKIYCQGDYIED